MKSCQRYAGMLCLLAVMLLCACRSEKSAYLASVNEGLVSFTDCANAVTDSIRSMADSRTVPTAAQLQTTEVRLDKLSAACERLESLTAPKSCLDQQAALQKAMADYRAAIDKCRLLMTFYRDYNKEIHTYATPTEGSAAMQTQMDALYHDLTEALWQARESLRGAQTAFAAE